MTAVVAGRRRIKRPGARAPYAPLFRSANGRRGVIFYCHRLTALGGVAARIRRPPGACGVESTAAVTGQIGYGADDGEGGVAATVDTGPRINRPDAGALDGLFGHGSDAG